MESDRWERLQEIYHQALALPPPEREAFIESACAGDPGLLSELRCILEAAHSRGGILDSPVVELGSATDGLVGQTLSHRYRVEEELPHGGMSQVYRAIDLKFAPKQVVIKVLSPTLTENSYAQKKFDQEVEALRRMEHPGVIRVEDRGELPGGRPYIVMPYIDGVSLRSQITSEGMDLERVASIVKQIGEALDHVHENGILHRDLKPENVMLRGGTDSVVLIDFGIAKVRASLIAPSTVSYAAAGTLSYMSPEQLRGENITRASDVYTMGIVAYEMVTGRRPFNPASPAQMLELQRAGPRLRPKQLRENLSDRADRAIIRALKFEPKARYQGAGEFGDEFSAALLADVGNGGGLPWWVKIVAGLVIIGVVSYGAYIYINRPGVNGGTNSDNLKSLIGPTPKPTLTPTAATHKITYFLKVQNVGSRKPYKSNGKDDTFESGARFQLNVYASDSGYLYVFDEGPPETNDTSFRMVYPKAQVNGGSATLGANQVVPTDWMTFHGPEGAENVWIVWSISPVSELEEARTEALKHPRGGLTGDRVVVVKSFLETKKNQLRVALRHYQATQKVDGTADADTLVIPAQFRHR